MTQPNSNPSQEAVNEELVAYLDGELGPAEADQIERRLTEDAEYRVQLNNLQRAWDMLDHLPRAQVGDAFTQTTIEMVAVNAEHDSSKRKGARRIRRTATWLGVVAAGVLAMLIGYRTVHQRLDEPNRQLLEEMPVVENVDLYYHAEDIEFLEKLAASGVFDDEVEPVDYPPQN